MVERKRYRNKTSILQVIYDERGDRREIVPGGTLILNENWGRKYRKILEPVVSKDLESETSGTSKKTKK